MTQYSVQIYLTGHAFPVMPVFQPCGGVSF